MHGSSMTVREVVAGAACKAARILKRQQHQQLDALDNEALSPEGMSMAQQVRDGIRSYDEASFGKVKNTPLNRQNSISTQSTSFTEASRRSMSKDTPPNAAPLSAESLPECGFNLEKGKTTWSRFDSTTTAGSTTSASSTESDSVEEGCTFGRVALSLDILEECHEADISCMSEPVSPTTEKAVQKVGDSLISEWCQTPSHEEVQESLQPSRLQTPAHDENQEPLSPCRPFVRDCCNESFVSGPSCTPSQVHYADPNQTLMFLDWDDTLFPTDAIYHKSGGKCTPEQKFQLDEWKTGLKDFLEVACQLSLKVAIVTNAVSPWVERCVDKFAPELNGYFAPETGVAQVCYAAEFLRSSSKGVKGFGRAPVICSFDASTSKKLDEEKQQELTNAKYAVMKDVAKRFYKSYPNQSWKNILSIGDAMYEHDALQELTFCRKGPANEVVYTKSLRVSTEPSIREITHRLQFLRLILPVCVQHGGDLNIDLDENEDALQTIADGLQMPSIAAIKFPRNTFGRCQDENEEIPFPFAALASAVYEFLVE